MSPASQDTLSALLDGECSSAELDRLLDELERSPQLKQSYSRLCQAREAAEGTRILRGQPCLAAGIMARIGQEPLQDSLDNNPRVVSLDTRRSADRPNRSWVTRLRPYAGFAAAASVAAMAVLVSMPGLRSGEGAGNGSASLVPSVSAPADFTPVSLPGSARARGLRAVALTPEEAEQMDELNSLLLEHSSSMADQGVGGTLRYARVAAHATPAVYRPDDNNGRDGR